MWLPLPIFNEGVMVVVLLQPLLEVATTENCEEDVPEKSWRQLIRKVKEELPLLPYQI